MDLIGPHPSFHLLLKYFWKKKPTLQVHNCDFSFRYSEIVDIMKDSEVITAVMIELHCTEIKNLPIVNVAKTCFNALKDQVPIHFALASSNRKNRIRLYVVPLMLVQASETNLVENSESSNPRRLEENRQSAEQYYLNKQPQAGSGSVAIPIASSSVSGLEINSETKDKEYILTQTHETKKVKSPKKPEQDRVRAEKIRMKNLATTKERICQMWAVPAEAKSVIDSLKFNSESSDQDS